MSNVGGSNVLRNFEEFRSHVKAGRMESAQRMVVNENIHTQKDPMNQDATLLHFILGDGQFIREIGRGRLFTLMDMLDRNNADINAITKSGATPMHKYVEGVKPGEIFDAEILSKLISLGAKPALTTIPERRSRMHSLLALVISPDSSGGKRTSLDIIREINPELAASVLRQFQEQQRKNINKKISGMEPVENETSWRREGPIDLELLQVVGTQKDEVKSASDRKAAQMLGLNLSEVNQRRSSQEKEESKPNEGKYNPLAPDVVPSAKGDSKAREGSIFHKPLVNMGRARAAINRRLPIKLGRDSQPYDLIK